MNEKIKKIISPIEFELNNFEKKLELLTCKQSNFLKNDLNKFLFQNPKRLRVIFVYLVAKILKIEKDVSNIAIALELIHSASLLHDDIIDEEIQRREELTFYKKYGTKLAILEGDLLLSVALQTLSNEKKEVISIFSDKIFKTIQAEINQFESKNIIPTMTEYLEKTLNKTGNLFLAGIKSLFELIEISEEQKTSLYNLTKNFSLAFQIKNDIDNFKKDLSDFKNGNYTLPVIYYFMENSNNDIDFNNSKFQKYIDISIEKMNEIKNNSLNELKKFENSIYTKALYELISEVLRS